MLSLGSGQYALASIEEFRRLVIAADAARASQLLIELCTEFPLLAGIVTLLKQGSIDEALNNVGMFDRNLANELRGHVDVLVQISVEMNKAGKRLRCMDNGGTCSSERPVYFDGKRKHFCDACGFDMQL